MAELSFSILSSDRSILDTPLFVKTHDTPFGYLQRPPKNLKQGDTSRLESLAFDFEAAILVANQARGRE